MPKIDRRKSRIRSDVEQGYLIVRRNGWFVPAGCEGGDIVGIYDGEDNIKFLGFAIVSEKE